MNGTAKRLLPPERSEADPQLSAIPRLAVVCYVYVVLIGIQFGAGKVFGLTFSHSSLLYSVLNSTVPETVEFLVFQKALVGKAIVYFLLAMAMMFGLFRLATRLARYTQSISLDRKWLSFSLLIGSLLGLSQLPRFAFFRLFAPSRAIWAGVVEYQAEMHKLKQLTDDLSKEKLLAQEEVRYHGPNRRTFLLVLGESTTRHNLQVYGYPRPTTPGLNALASELAVFSDVVSPHAHTIPSLVKMLTFASWSNPDDFHQKANMIHLSQAAGFKVYWSSNQQILGNSDTVSTVLAKLADETRFRNVGTWDGIGLTPHDEVLLKDLGEFLSEEAPKKLIVLHMMGTHHDYKNRYPDSFAKFTADDDDSINQQLGRRSKNSRVRSERANYDNAVLYLDHVLSSAIRMLKEREEESEFLFISDHGESVGHQSNFIGHSEGLGFSEMFEVPMIYWSSSAAKRKSARQRVGRPFDSSYLDDSVLDLLGIECSSCERGRSVFFRDYRPPLRVVANRDYDRLRPATGGLFKLQASGVGKRDFPSKRWVHRTNSREKFALLAEKYEGFEVDIVVRQEGFLEVNHPPEPSANRDFESFASVKRAGEKYFWLDIKNLESSNLSILLSSLVRLHEKGIRKSHLVLESPNLEVLSKLGRLGYYVSFYVTNPHDPGGMALELAKNPVNALSFDYQNWELIQDTFQDYDFLTWFVQDLNEAEKNEQIKVILVPEKTPFDR